MLYIPCCMISTLRHCCNTNNKQLMKIGLVKRSRVSSNGWWCCFPCPSSVVSWITLLLFPIRSGTVRRSNSPSPVGFAKIGASPPFSGEHGAVPSSRRFSFGGAKPYTPSPQGKMPASTAWHVAAITKSGTLEKEDGLMVTARAGSQDCWIVFLILALSCLTSVRSSVFPSVIRG